MIIVLQIFQLVQRSKPASDTITGVCYGSQHDIIIPWLETEKWRDGEGHFSSSMGCKSVTEMASHGERERGMEMMMMGGKIIACFLMFQILPGVRIIIANPETKGPLGDSHLGEVCLPSQN